MVKMRYLPRRGACADSGVSTCSTSFGAGFTAYGLCLLLFFQSGHYLLFYYVFLLPILMIFRFFRDRSAFRARQGAAPSQAAPSGYGQPPGYGQPSGGQPQGPVQ
jgi:hypothetical protein